MSQDQPRTKLLLHACCGPCATGALLAPELQDAPPILYWNNPNIHPLTEYLSRLGGLRTLCEKRGLPLIVDGDYGLRPFAAATAADPDGRCSVCYEMRLSACAQYAAQNGFTAFSTTLLISPYQDHELLRETAERAAQKYGVAFWYCDFRPYFREGQQKAREMELYRQKYCGCMFSEEDRYAKKRDKVKKGFFPNFQDAEAAAPKEKDAAETNDPGCAQ